MASFFMNRLSAAFELVKKTRDVFCRKAAELAKMRIALGHFWTIGLNNLAVSARIWSILGKLLQEIAQLHEKLVPFFHILPNCRNIKISNIQLDGILMSPERRERTQTGGEGEIISRISSPLPCRQKHWNAIVSSVAKLTSKKAVEDFVMEENARRKTERRSCVTKLLERSDWKQMKMFLLIKGKQTHDIKAFHERITIWMLYPSSRGETDQLQDNWGSVRSELKLQYE